MFLFAFLCFQQLPEREAQSPRHELPRARTIRGHFLRQKLSRAAVEPHAERRGLCRTHALAQKRRDQACQHVPAPTL